MTHCFKMDKTLCFVLVTALISLSTSEDQRDSNQNRKRIVSDPVSNLFADIGDLFLDVDQALAVHTGPKVEYEGNLVSKLFRPRTDYFDRIQKNYKDMQRRLGSLIGNALGPKSSYSERELSTVSPALITENKYSTTPANNRMDHNPFAAADEEKKNEIRRMTPRASAHQNIECSNVMLDDPVLENLRQTKCSRNVADKGRTDFERFMLQPIRASETILSVGSKALDDLSRGIFRQLSEGSKERDSLSISVHQKVNKDFGAQSNKKNAFVRADECSKEVLADPILEGLRKERCAHIEFENQARGNFINSGRDPKSVTDPIVPLARKEFDQFFKNLLGRSVDITNQELSLASDTDNEKRNEGSLDAVNYECSSEVLADPVQENIRKENCARMIAEERIRKNFRQLMLDSKSVAESLIPIGSEAVDQLSKTLVRRSGDAEESDKPEGRIIGDLLYSESSFDKNLREFLRRHGQWLLDNPLLSRWRMQPEDKVDISTQFPEVDEPTTFEIATEPKSDIQTDASISTSADTKTTISKSEESFPDNIHKSTYYRIVNKDGKIEEDVDIVLEPDYVLDDSEVVDEIEVQEPRDTVILAFTLDGVPLKLRMGPEIDNPLRHLHKVLKSGGVSLNIPVESYDDLEPVGKEVFRLGSGILTRAVLIDMSNNSEVKSLLKALMASKSSGKKTF